ncbi:hypothetical protein [Bacillus inaquosorum]|uniref:hypothetical protein n=1 Tax=Bacillus inaquosorum TaxID=483913 RepID=UPI00227EF527|nr:hypothetical protein [Bacillus inaquosorum]MCY8879417.1 hypothetical protein [Bacillus inaquosorum]MEC0772765.1 hypothetical protein [Bacillus inaquosorum]MEC0797186.1 hypothetical protein [Bacillus inaquosorum]
MKLTGNEQLLFCFVSADCDDEIPSRSVIFAAFLIGNLTLIAEQMTKKAPLKQGAF